MNSICIDTSLGFCSIAILKGSQTFFYSSKQKSNQSEEVFPIIDKLLKEANLKTNDLKKAFCVIGPGSFTGIRIGIAAARGLAIVNKDLLLFGITNMQLLAFQSQHSSKLVILNAYRGQIYFQKFDENTPTNQIELIDLGTLDYYHHDEVIIGDHNLDEISNKKIIKHEINAKIMAEFVRKQTSDKHYSACSPLYVRQPDAKPPKRMFDL